MSPFQQDMPKKPGDGRRARKDANRERVLEAAFDLFRTGGEAALTMRRLAAESGVSDATPYNLFHNKTGVLVAMFETFLDQLPKTVPDNKHLNALEQFLLVTESVAKLWSEPSGLFCGLMAAMQKMGDMPREIIERPQRGIGAAMARLQDEDWIADTVPPQDVANRIAHANAGLFGLWQSGRLSRGELVRELKLNALIPILAASSDYKRKHVLALLEQALEQET